MGKCEKENLMKNSWLKVKPNEKGQNKGKK
jgi:hypothetical protein